MLVRIDPAPLKRRYPPCGTALLRAYRCALPGRDYVVLEYADRIAIRSTDGEAITSWTHMQAIKEDIWPGDFAVEIFPPQSQVIDMAPTRHLWRTDQIVSEAAVCSARLHRDVGRRMGRA